MRGSAGRSVSATAAPALITASSAKAATITGNSTKLARRIAVRMVLGSVLLAVIGGSVVALVSAGLSATEGARSDGTRWYIADLRQKTCVPLDEVGDGTMRTPEDIVNTMRGPSVTVTKWPGSTGPVQVYEFHGAQVGDLVFSSDLEVCRSRMGLLPK